MGGREEGWKEKHEEVREMKGGREFLSPQVFLFVVATKGLDDFSVLFFCVFL